MAYPTLEQYNEALQHPQTAFFDSELKMGNVSTTGLGLPLALCGGFALTYSIQCAGKKYAVRCFHKKSNLIESRYKAISNKIGQLRSPYFVHFEFQNTGIKVNGQIAPIVKMMWASGETLGEFIEGNYRKRDKLTSLRNSLQSLARFLEEKGIAHGDIQPGNVMVSSGGQAIQLIDYDGMYVDEIRSIGGAELGHRNFQHPKRNEQVWNAQLDRFSFIELNLALSILEVHPDFWGQTRSDGDSILFKANDLANPSSSSLLSNLSGIPQFSTDVKNFAAICQSHFEKIPTLEDFIAERNIPQVQISISAQPTAAPQQYIGAYAVLDASNYLLCLQYVGDRVELVGKVVEVKEGKTRRGKPYVFINFGHWKGQTVKISIWSEGLAALTQKPNSSLIGKWIAVTGLMEPPYQNARFNYSHLSISITQANQLHILQEAEARYRLGVSGVAPRPISTSSNQSVLTAMKGETAPSSGKSTTASAPVSRNASVLQAMKKQQPSVDAPAQRSSQQRASQPPKGNQSGDFGWIWWLIIGAAVFFFLSR